MRKIVAVLAVLVLIFSLAGGAWANGPGDEGVRIALTAAGARAAGLAVRHQFGDRVTAQASLAQLRVLERLGYTYEVVPLRFIDGAPAGAPANKGSGKPGGGGGGSSRSATPAFQVPYGVKMIYGNPSLTTAGVSGGSGITVAVLDTGTISHFDFTRPDGSSIITGCVDFSQNKSPQVENTCTDGHGHGTHVIGSVAAAGGRDGLGLVGVAPGASVYAYKVMNNSGRGYADDIARAIRVAADRGAHIISMSLGSSSPSSDELAAIRYANSLGVLVIAAAGNSGPNPDTIAYPGAFREVVAVAALNKDEVVSYFSSRGISDGNDSTVADREVEVAGPGRAVYSTTKDGAYGSMSGTSMATPHIAGLAAKMWQGSAAATRSWLVSRAQAHDITQAEQINNAAAGYDIAAGYGLPQVSTSGAQVWSD